MQATALLVVCLSLATFTTAQTQFAARPIGAQLASSAHFADLDGDGDQDLVFARFPDMAWRENDGAGGFSTEQPISIPALTQVPTLACGDFDGDGDTDCLVIGFDLQSYLIVNTGGAPQSTSLNLPTQTSSGTGYALPLDADGDGDLDVVYVSVLAAPLLLRNDGAGGFAVERGLFPGTAVTLAAHAAAGDVDGDGDVDVLAAGLLGSFLWLNDGTGRFVLQLAPLPSTSLSRALIADFTGDGIGDLAALRASGGPLEIWAGSTSGTFTVVQSMASPQYFALAAADADGDGDQDLFASSPGTGQQILNLLLNDGSGRFTNVTTSRVDSVAEYLTRLAVADVDGDGDVDAFVAGYPLPVTHPGYVFVNHQRQVGVTTQPMPGETLRIQVSHERGYGRDYGLALPVLGPRAATVATLFGLVHMDAVGAIPLPFVSLPAPGGQGETLLAVPNDPALSGTEVLVQALILEPFGPAPPRLTGFARVVVR